MTSVCDYLDRASFQFSTRQQMKQITFGKVLRAGAWGAIVGGAAGFALGLLVAPEEGRTVRRRLAYQLENLAGLVGSYVDQVVRSQEESAARRTGDALVADAQEKASRIRREIDDLLAEIRQQNEARTP